MKKNKNTIISIIISITLIAIAIFIKQEKTNSQEELFPISSIKNNFPSSLEKTDNPNIQIIEIKAKGGYTPRKSIAKAGVPTILRFDTNGTFDCSSSVRIPSMNIFKNLPQSGTTDIDLGVQKSGTLQGMCGMGMYPFEIDFQ
jgi:plastocyanin domain-containing protein